MTEAEKNRSVLAANSRWYLAANIIGHLYVVLTIPMLTRHISAQEFGFYILIAQMVSILQSVGLFFFSQSLLRFHIEWEGEAKQVFYGTVLISVVGIELVLSGTVYFWRQELVPLLYPNANLPLDPHVGWACMWLLLATVRALTLTKIKAEERPGLAMGMSLSYGVFLIVALYTLVVKADGGLAAALTSFVIGEAGAFLCVGLYAWRGVRLSWRLEILGRVVKFSLPLAASSILFVLSANMDRKVLSEYVSLEEVGVYGIGFFIGNILSLFVSSYAAAFTARGLKLWKMEGRVPLENLVEMGMKDCVPMVGAALGGVMIFGSFAAHLLNHGDARGPVVAVATGVGVGHLVRLIFIHAQNVLFIGERTGRILVLNGGLLVMTWLVAHILINTGGSVAVALTMPCAYLLLMPLAFFMAKSICSIRLPWKTLARLGLGLTIIAVLEYSVTELPWGSSLSEVGRKALQIGVLMLTAGPTLLAEVKAVVEGLWSRAKQPK